MGRMSFKHLKKSAELKSENKTEPTISKTTTAGRKSNSLSDSALGKDPAILVEPRDADKNYYSPIVPFSIRGDCLSSQQKKEAPLMESGYCYGCVNFSVDAPGTAHEMGWCRRYDKEGKLHFKRILSDILIRQCKRRSIT